MSYWSQNQATEYAMQSSASCQEYPQGLTQTIVTDQPQWMVMHQAYPGCPPGLEYLAHLDQLLIHQQVELLDGMCTLHYSS